MIEQKGKLKYKRCIRLKNECSFSKMLHPLMSTDIFRSIILIAYDVKPTQYQTYKSTQTFYNTD